MIQGEADLRAEPAASRLTNPTTSEMPKRFGAKRQNKRLRWVIGARIRLTTRDGAQHHHQYNQMTSAVGYASSSYGGVHFGLGKAESVEEIEIKWPSGTVQELRNVRADQVLKVREPNPSGTH